MKSLINRNLREFYGKRYPALKSEMDKVKPSWRDLQDYILPRNTDWLDDTTTTRNKGSAWDKIIDARATQAAGIMAAGIMGGLTSPSRPWFMLQTQDSELNESRETKVWLSECTRIVQDHLRRSNVYKVLPNVYLECEVMGTTAVMMEEHPTDGFRFFPIPLGSYVIAGNREGRVDTLYRRITMTSRQIVDEYGEENCPRNVREEVRSGKTENKHQVMICVAPNADADPKRLESQFKPFISLHYVETHNEDDEYLRISGFDEFPYMVPRWDTAGDETWASRCPGMASLGDVKSLQILHRRKAQAVDKKVNPPMQGPASLRQSRVSNLPGGMTYVDSMGGRQAITRLYDIDYDTSEARADIGEIHMRIRSHFLEDLFLMISSDERSNITAQEIRAREEEKMQVMGPALERLDDELLDPMISRAFSILYRQGRFPPAPPALEGQELTIHYTSILAAAMRMRGLVNAERWISSVIGMSEVRPELLDIPDWDKIVRDIGDKSAISPEYMRSDEDVAAEREARAQAMARQEAQAQQMQQAQIAKDLGAANTGEDTLLNQMITDAGAAA